MATKKTPDEILYDRCADDKGTCPFCGSPVLYDTYHYIDGDPQLMRFCNSCKMLFTIEDLADDYDTDGGDIDRMDVVFKAPRKTYEDWKGGRDLKRRA